MKEVNLSPFKGSLGAVGSTGGAGLDSLHVANVLDHVNRAVAAIILTTAGKSGGNQGKSAAKDSERLHFYFCGARFELADGKRSRNEMRGASS